MLLLFSATASWGQTNPAEMSQGASPHTLKRLQQMTDAGLKELDDQLAQALTYYYDEDYSRALPIFEAISQQAETLDLLFWYGTCAQRTGDFPLAIRLFDKMLTENSNLPRVRMELAVAYIEMGQFDQARTHLGLVRSEDPPDEVLKNIRNLEKHMNQKRPRPYRLRLSQGIVYDSNASSGPDDRSFSVLGGTLNIAEMATKQSDTASVTSVSGDYYFDSGDPSGLLWAIQGSAYYKSYFNYDQFNYGFFDINAGPQWAASQQRLALPVGYTYRLYGDEELSYSLYTRPSYQYAITSQWSMGGRYNLRLDEYANDRKSLNSTDHRFEVTPRLISPDKQHRLQATLGYAVHDADSDFYAYQGMLAGLTYRYRLPTRTELHLGYRWAFREYREHLPFYRDDREDQIHQINVGITQDIWKYFYANLRFSYMNNHSNHEVYAYDRILFGIHLGAKF